MLFEFNRHERYANSVRCSYGRNRKLYFFISLFCFLSENQVAQYSRSPPIFMNRRLNTIAIRIRSAPTTILPPSPYRSDLQKRIFLFFVTGCRIRTESSAFPKVLLRSGFRFTVARTITDSGFRRPSKYFILHENTRKIVTNLKIRRKSGS